ncbi:MAG: hypothetical protein V4548_13040 [Bacteroidota bacterium]
MRLFFLFSCCLFNFSNIQAQNIDFEKYIVSADSIQIALHDNFPGGSTRIQSLPQIIIDDLPNQKIIWYSLTLNNQAKKTLIDIFTKKEEKMKNTAYSLSFDKAVIIYRNGKCKYITFDIGGHHFMASEDLEFNHGFMYQDERWQELEEFFNNEILINK